VSRVSFVLLLAGCAYSNHAILADLEAQEAVPALDAAIERGGPVPVAGLLREATLPMVEGKVPAVKGRINGVEMPLVLDTGTSAVTVTAEAARDARLYLPRRRPATSVSPGYVATIRECAFESLELGPNRFGAGVATVPLDERPGRWMDLGAERYAIVGCCHVRLREEGGAPPTHGTPGVCGHPLHEGRREREALPAHGGLGSDRRLPRAVGSARARAHLPGAREASRGEGGGRLGRALLAVHAR
jgi:hypothetical protein